MKALAMIKRISCEIFAIFGEPDGTDAHKTAPARFGDQKANGRFGQAVRAAQLLHLPDVSQGLVRCAIPWRIFKGEGLP